MPNCKNCQNNFVITDLDRRFYNKIDVPEPELCPDCRHQLRYVFRNERSLYLRKCDFCNKEMVSIYAADSPYKIYCKECYFSDKWEATEYKTDFDFSRSFFEQFKELKLKVPLLGLDINNCVNTDYANIVLGDKNCYMVFGTVYSEDSCYCRKLNHSKDCLDINYGKKLELCYDCIDCQSCYRLLFSHDCEGCSFSSFLYDCHGCEYCFLCSNLRNARYCFLNQQLTKEEYESKIIGMGSWVRLQEYKEKFNKVRREAVNRDSHSLKSIGCTGDYLTNCKNCSFCFDLGNSEDCKYCVDGITGANTSMDCTCVTIESEGDFECASCSQTSFSYFSTLCRDGNYNLFYCDSIHGSHDLFSCVGLNKKQFCILNKQYSEREYQKLRTKIIDHMKKTGEWGRFFPADISPFCYNETVSFEIYPLTEAEAVRRGYSWKTKDKREYMSQDYDVSDDIKDIPDEITKKILACLGCDKNYKITKQELDFYRKMKLPIPRQCFDCRCHDRAQKRNPRRLWDRQCFKCHKQIKTTHAPDRPEKVYCEECYQKEIY